MIWESRGPRSRWSRWKVEKSSFGLTASWIGAICHGMVRNRNMNQWIWWKKRLFLCLKGNGVMLLELILEKRLRFGGCFSIWRRVLVFLIAGSGLLLLFLSSYSFSGLQLLVYKSRSINFWPVLEIDLPESFRYQSGIGRLLNESAIEYLCLREGNWIDISLWWIWFGWGAGAWGLDLPVAIQLISGWLSVDSWFQVHGPRSLIEQRIIWLKYWYTKKNNIDFHDWRI